MNGENNKLGEGSSVNTISIPNLPAISPPATTVDYPDEPSVDLPTVASSSTSAARPNPIRDPSSSIIDSPLTNVPLDTSITSLVDGVEEEPTVNMSQIQPRPFVPRDYTPPPELDVPEWVPLDNYRPAATPTTPPQLLMPLTSAYATELPPLPLLNSTSSSASFRRRKRTNSPQPDMFKLQATFSLNPLSSALTRSSKCVLTCDWKVAMDEMRHVRAMERIEAKKAENRWSLRQPKKARGPGVPKSHWDYMLEEMEWMRTDFAEERRWKVVEAREFAYQVVEWHLASPEEKKALMVGGRGWGECRNVPIPGHAGKRKEVTVEVEAEDEDVEMLVGQEGELDGEGEANKVLESIDEMRVNEKERENRPEDPRETVNINQDIGEEVDAEGEADADGEPENGEADAEGEADADGGPVGDDVVGLSEIDAAQDDTRETSERPSYRRDTVLPNGLVIHKRFANAYEIAIARGPVLDTPLANATVDLDTLTKSSSAATPATVPAEPSVSPDEPASFDQLFPDLAMYSGPAPPENDKKYRRDEGGTYSHRMAHTSRIMDIRPILVSTLQPAKNLIDGEWDLHDGPYYEEVKGAADIPPNVVAAFNTPFGGKASRPLEHMRVPEVPKPAAHHLRAQLLWSPEEDKCLLKLVAMYPFNWDLIADSFNTEMILIPVEKRNPYECWERWYYTFGEGKNKPRQDAPPSAPPPAPASATQPGTATATPVPQSAVTTPGVPPSANLPSASGRPQQTGGNSVSSLPTPTGEALPDGAPPPPGMSKRDRMAAKPKYEGTKRSVRHQAIYDAVKRMNRRREAARAKSHKDNAQRKVINVHESHSMSFPHVAASTPWELVEAKYQRDVQIAQQRQQRAMQEQQRQLAIRQQQAMMSAQQQAQMRPPNMPNVPNMPNAQPIRMGPNGQPMPTMAPSQQQLLNAVAAATAANRQNANGAVQGNPNVRPMPVVQGQSPQVQQQMLLQAQQMAAQQARVLQAQAQAQAQQGRAPSMGGNLQPPQLGVSSPFAQSRTPDLPAEGAGPSGINPTPSPAMQAAAIGAQSSPQIATMGRAPSNNVPPHLRVPNAGTSSPQISSPMALPQGIPNGAGMPVQGAQTQGIQIPAAMMNNATVQQLLATLAASGQQMTPEQLRGLMLRSAHMQAQAQSQVGNPGTPQMGVQNIQGVQHFARSPSLQNAQSQPRSSPKPGPANGQGT